jgi:hypothetical protein
MLTVDAVQSARQLGADKRVAMWQADSQLGMVVIKAPEVTKISHHVPILESRFKDDDEPEQPS